MSFHTNPQYSTLIHSNSTVAKSPPKSSTTLTPPLKGVSTVVEVWVRWFCGLFGSTVNFGGVTG